jgi:membrane-associated phospholipid phosphatase
MSGENIDSVLLVWSHQIRTDLMDRFFSAVTWTGSLYVLLPLAVLLSLVLIKTGVASELTLLWVGFGGATASAYTLKALVQRPRPDLYPPLIPLPADSSFPSAHTTQILAFCLCVLLIAVRHHPSVHIWLLAAILAAVAICVGFSRVYLQVHYVSDVAAGALLAVVWVAGATLLLRRGP